jgi:carbon storage regulator
MASGKQDEMLVLSRKEGERLHLGDAIEVVVLRSRRGRVQLGIVAPSDVQIQREEVRRRMLGPSHGGCSADRPNVIAVTPGPLAVR